MKADQFHPADFVLPPEPAVRNSPISITINGPRNEPFMLHPGLSFGPVWVVYSANQWHLLTPEVGNGFVQGKSKADLFLGITAAGDLFILLVLHPWKGKPMTWKDSADEIVVMAQRQWLQMTSNRPEERFDYRFVDLDQSPSWPRGLSEKTILHAFGDRIISRANEHRLLGTLARPVHENCAYF